MSEIVLNGNIGTTKKKIGTKILEVYEMTTYEIKERWVETDVLMGHEEVPQKKRETYLEVATKLEEIEVKQ